MDRRAPKVFCFHIQLPVRGSSIHTPFTTAKQPHLPNFSASNRCRLSMSSAAAGHDDLLIIGAGHLGRLIGQDWLAKHPSAKVVGETGSDSSHSLLQSQGIIPAIAGSTPGTFPHVVFCAPPSKFSDYAGAVAEATSRVSQNGRFAFTSSSSVYGEAKNINEKTPPDEENPRSKLLTKVEQNVMAIPEGRVARLSGLFLVDRGPHTFWLRRGEVSGSPDAMVNLVHYNDVAKAVVKILKGGPGVEEAEEKGGRVFLICGGKSTSRRGIIEAALRHPMFDGKNMPSFGDAPAGEAKHYDCSWTRKALGWKPEFECFEEFMEADALRKRNVAGAHSG